MILRNESKCWFLSKSSISFDATNKQSIILQNNNVVNIQHSSVDLVSHFINQKLEMHATNRFCIVTNLHPVYKSLSNQITVNIDNVFLVDFGQCLICVFRTFLYYVQAEFNTLHYNKSWELNNIYEVLCVLYDFITVVTLLSGSEVINHVKGTSIFCVCF